MTDAIVGAGLAVYVENPADRRAQIAQLTDTGVAALRSIQRRQIAWANGCADGLTPAELVAAAAFLHGLAERLGA